MKARKVLKYLFYSTGPYGCFPTRLEPFKQKVLETNVPTAEFLLILEDAIRTFVNFVWADKESYYRKIGAFSKKNQGSVDPTLLHLIKKANKRKKRKLKDLQRSKKCFRKKRLKEEEEMELLMSRIDLKFVSRLWRMSELNEEQLCWCEEKMNKVFSFLHIDPTLGTAPVMIQNSLRFDDISCNEGPKPRSWLTRSPP